MKRLKPPCWIALLLLIGLTVYAGCDYLADRSEQEQDIDEFGRANIPEGMVWIPSGGFRMGNRFGAPDKNPKHLDVIPEHNDAMHEHVVTMTGFWMDKTEVTNRQFKAFVDATGYVTTAETDIDLEKMFAEAGRTDKPPTKKAKACSICYNSKFDPKNVDKHAPNWVYSSGIWAPVEGANWRQPEGKGSSIKDRMDYPVVHISYDDALAYCEWAGKELPTEAQWEYAARGGLNGKKYSWGDELKPGGKWQANIWQGEFPFNNTEEDGFRFAAPVKSFPPNAYGLYDMAGNVWEWCADWYFAGYDAGPVTDPTGPDSGTGRVVRGGEWSHSIAYSRLANRDFTRATRRDLGNGFRVACDIASGHP